MVKVTTTTGVLSSVSGTSGRITEWSDGTTIGASTLIKSGAGVLTLSASGTATLTIDSTTRLDGSGAASGDVLTWNGTAYSPAAASGPTGSGTANYVAYWTGTNTLSGDTDFRFDGTRAALGTTINSSYRMVIHGTGSGSTTYGLLVENSGGTDTLRVRDDGSTLLRTATITGSGTGSGTYGLTVTDSGGTPNFYVRDDGVGYFLGQLSVEKISNNTGGPAWDLGSFTASGDVASNGYVTVTVNGTSYRLMTRA
jgi:hypothetical protein